MVMFVHVQHEHPLLPNNGKDRAYCDPAFSRSVALSSNLRVAHPNLKWLMACDKFICIHTPIKH